MPHPFHPVFHVIRITPCGPSVTHRNGMNLCRKPKTASLPASCHTLTQELEEHHDTRGRVLF